MNATRQNDAGSVVFAVGDNKNKREGKAKSHKIVILFLHIRREDPCEQISTKSILPEMKKQAAITAETCFSKLFLDRKTLFRRNS